VDRQYRDRSPDELLARLMSCGLGVELARLTGDEASIRIPATGREAGVMSPSNGAIQTSESATSRRVSDTIGNAGGD
jgi:hypothetical protein